MPSKPLRALQREVAGELVRSTDRTTIAGVEREYLQMLGDGKVRPSGTLTNMTVDLHSKLARVRAEEDGDLAFTHTMELLISEVWRMKAEPKEAQT